MASLIDDVDEPLLNGDRIVAKTWEDGRGEILSISFSYLTREGVRIYAIDDAHGVLHEHHGPWRVPLSYERQVLGRIRSHFLRIARLIESTRTGRQDDNPDS